MCGNMLLWNGAREILHLFYCVIWETSSHYIAILGVSLHERNIHSVSSYLVVSSPGCHHFRGFLIYKVVHHADTRKQFEKLKKGKKVF